jgi:DNA-binding MarR family transcriptional regulator
VTTASPAKVTDRDEQLRALGMKLTTVGRQLWLQFNQSAERTGITRAQWTLIAAVSHRPGATQRVIATTLQVTEVTAGRLIDQLCEDGYLERHANPDDRRSYSVYLTPKAQPVLDQLGELAQTHTDQAFAGLSASEVDKLGQILDKIAGNIGALRGK